VIDKTGTLTEGKPQVTAVQGAPGRSTEEILRLAASLERGSQHPLAAAIVAAAQRRRLPLAEAADFDAPSGKGVAGSVEGRRLLIGSRRFLEEAGIDMGSGLGGALTTVADRKRAQGETVVLVAIDGQPAGAIAIADPVKASTPAALAALKQAGIRVVMLTGDNIATARAVAARLGIGELKAEVLPEDKRRLVEGLRRQGRVVAMAGDGVNDAPALAAADVGIAMGTGTEVAMESAGVTLVKGDLNGIVRAMRLSAATMANIRQNLVLAFVYNAAGIPIAAGVLYPVLGMTLSPVIAAAAMAASSVSVIANALRLNRVAL
jgi:Cu+-exporting ATPase